MHVGLSSESPLLRVLREELGDRELPCFFGAVSQVTFGKEQAEGHKHAEEVIVPSGEKVKVSVAPVGKNKCPRCWMRGSFDHLCPRCDAVLRK